MFDKNFKKIGYFIELIQNVFFPYVEKHRGEFEQQYELTSSEIAKRQLNDFVQMNNITMFNTRQRIILVASEFDEQTLSAVAWLNSNQVDISCYQIYPYKINDTILIDMKKVLPIVEYDDFYVNVVEKGSVQKKQKKDISRRSLPKIDVLIEWGVVNKGDIIVAKGRTEEAELQANGQVKIENDIMSLQQWLKKVFSWSSVATYEFSVHKKTGKTLSELRQEYMEQNINGDMISTKNIE